MEGCTTGLTTSQYRESLRWFKVSLSTLSFSSPDV